jgi:cystathionine beta-synthase
MFVGYTSGAAMQAAIQLKDIGEFNENSEIVIIFPDHGSKYMSKIYNEDWMKKEGFINNNQETIHQIEYI